MRSSTIRPPARPHRSVPEHAGLAHRLQAVLRSMLEQQWKFRMDQLAQLRSAQSSGPLASNDPEILSSLRDGARSALAEIESALHRMDTGTYGLCVACGQPIGLARLEVLPQTALCMICRRTWVSTAAE